MFANAAEIDAAALDHRLAWAAAAWSRLVNRTRSRDGAGASRITPPAVAAGAAALLVRRLGLAPNQCDALWLLASLEIDLDLAGIASGVLTADCAEVSVALLQQALACAGSTRLASAQLQGLIDLGLVETTSDPQLSLQRRWIRSADRVIEALSGDLSLDRDIADIGTLHFPEEASACDTEIPDVLVRVFHTERAPFVVALGREGSGRATLLGHAAARARTGILRVSARGLVHDARASTRQLRAIARECCLFDVVPMVEDADLLAKTETSADRLHYLAQLQQLFGGPVLVTATESRDWPTTRPTVVHEVRPPSQAERAVLWRRALPDASDEVIADAAPYFVGPATIFAAAENARLAAGSAPVTSEQVHEGVRACVDHALGGLAQRVKVTQTWNDVVLPAEDMELFVELTARARQHDKVLEEWGFADKTGRGHGLCALLSGPPGTGKTMIAGIIANDLGLDLYQVDLSKIVSKYIGETEKQLAKVFDAAEAGHAVLLFDEADSLFAKRSEVKSANDRYANLEVNYLLQRIESYLGIVLLTSNHESAIDDAFRRRLAMHVRFPMPEEKHRSLIWRAMLPAKAEVEPSIDLERLAREFNMSGGHIKNAVLRAAYVAADRGEAIGMDHLWHGARLEYEAMGRIVTYREA